MGECFSFEPSTKEYRETLRQEAQEMSPESTFIRLAIHNYYEVIHTSTGSWIGAELPLDTFEDIDLEGTYLEEQVWIPLRDQLIENLNKVPESS